MLNLLFFAATRTPFYVRFRSDSYEFTNAGREGKGADTGFMLAYIMDSMNCI